MKRILIILTLIVLTKSGNAQLLDTTKLDTLRLFIHVADTTHYWDYFKSNGVLAWGSVVGYDAALIPPGGSVKRNYTKNTFAIVNGFGIIKSDTVGNITQIRYLDLKYKPIKNKWVLPEIILR